MNHQPPPHIAALKQKFGLCFGLLAGAAFALAAWGSDARLLAQGHVVLAGFKLLAGGALALLVGALAGWLTARFDRPLASLAFWIAATLFLTVLSIRLPVELYYQALRLFEPDLAALVTYQQPDATIASAPFIAMIIGGVGVVTALLQMYLVDTALAAAAPAGRFLPLSAAIILFGVAGLVAVDVLINSPLRVSLLATHDLLQFAAEHQGQEVDPALARQMHLRSLAEIEAQVGQPYRLLLKDFNADVSQATVLLDFRPDLAACLVYGQSVLICRPGVTTARQGS